VENVIIAFTRGASPDVGQREAHLLHVIQVAEENLVIDRRPEVPRPEKVDWVEVGDVNSARVGHGRVGAVLLNVHAEEADVHAVNLLEGEESAGAVREGLAHLAGVDKSGKVKIEEFWEILFIEFWNIQRQKNIVRWLVKFRTQIQLVLVVHKWT